MKSVICLLGAAAIVSATERTIVTFDGAKATTFNWYTSDDPVMGGSSKSAWQLENNRGSWAGQVKIVSFLGAPGFCSVGSYGYNGDWSSVGVDGSAVVHLRINPRNKGMPNAQTLTHFALQFHSSKAGGYKKGEFACPMTIDLKAPWGVSKAIKIPFSSCSQSWRGQPEGGPPTIEQLASINRIRFSTGAFSKGKETGYAGHFDLELERVDIVSAANSKNIVELAAGTKDLSTLVAALKAGKLVSALEGPGPFTVFAPSNEAFAKLPEATLKSLLDPKNIKQLDAILEYHVVAGAAVYSKDLKSEQEVKTLEGQKLTVRKSLDGVTINGKSKVTTADVGASNGVVHIIDTVLIPPSVSAVSKNIVELAAGTKDLSTLVAALKAGKLVSALEGPGPFTVFAPSNEAFAKLPEATLKSLLDPKNIKQLDAILEYHVVAGAAVYSKDLKSEQEVKTLEGQKLTVRKSLDGVTINGKSKVTTADVGASNGVVHIIDTVLIPQSHSGCIIRVPKTLQPQYAFEFAALDKNQNDFLDPSEFKNIGVKLANRFDSYRSWGGRRLRGSWSQLLRHKLKEKRDAMRAAKVFRKFDENHSHYISLCEFENSMYHEKLEDDKYNHDAVVVVHDH